MAYKINLYGYVGDEINARDVRFELECSEQDTSGEVEIHILTYGGDPLESFAIVDLIEQYKAKGKKIITVNDGYVHSAGTNILAAGDVVKATRNSTTHTHRVSAEGSYTSETGLQMVKNVADITSVSASILARKTGKTVDEIYELMDKESEMTVGVAMEFGLVDEIYTGAIDPTLAQKVLTKYKQKTDEGNFTVILQEVVDLSETYNRIMNK